MPFKKGLTPQIFIFLLIFLQATSKNAVTSAIDKARESCVMIQSVKKTKSAKSGKSNATSAPALGPSVTDIDMKDVKKSAEEQKKKPAESKKSGKKVIIKQFDVKF